jgi:hypothetical protein
MYYLKPFNNKNYAEIYGYKPVAPYVEVDELPERPKEKRGYNLQICADTEEQRVWYGYFEIEAIPEQDLTSILGDLVVDHEYRLILLETGVNK